GTASHGEIASKNSRPAACAADPLATLSLSAPSASSASHLSTSPQSGRDRAHPPAPSPRSGREHAGEGGAPAPPPPRTVPPTHPHPPPPGEVPSNARRRGLRLFRPRLRLPPPAASMARQHAFHDAHPATPL